VRSGTHFRFTTHLLAIDKKEGRKKEEASASGGFFGYRKLEVLWFLCIEISFLAYLKFVVITKQ
jgi:hypothetical protein